MPTITALNSYFTTLIDSIMETESAPLARLQKQLDSINVQRSAYTDVKSKLSALQTSVQALISTSGAAALFNGRSASITPLTTGTTVLTASPSSSSAVGSYEVAVTTLAEVERQASAVQASIDLALGKSGSLWLGGTGTAGASFTTREFDPLNAVGAAQVLSGKAELASGDYTLETRSVEGQLQFRIKDADGSLLSIQDRNGQAGQLTTGWQNVTSGLYDTGRGLTLTLDAGGAAGSTAMHYTAAGVEVQVEASDTLLGIAGKVNAAMQPEGRQATAAVIGKQLVLSAVKPGTNHTMLLTDGVGLGFATVQNAANASFSVNDLPFTTSLNGGLTNIINGVTLNLAGDAAGKSAVLEISKDLSGPKKAIDAFITSFNATQTFINEKMAITSRSNGDKLTYTRGALAGDSVFGDLRTRLFSIFMEPASNTGKFRSLREIGLTINDSLQATISDQSKLDEALQNSPEDVRAILDVVMGAFDQALSRYTGVTTGYLDQAVSSLDRQIKDVNADITNQNLRLLDREQALITQFGEMQVQLLTLTYNQNSMMSIYGNFNSQY